MIKEDVPATTTNNAGVGLDTPKLPIKLFKRFKEVMDKSKRVQSK